MRYWGRCLAVATLAVGLLGGTAVWGEQPAGTRTTGTPAVGTTVAATQVNINTADAAALEALPGIGPVKAKAVIDYREKNGPFKTIDDLKNVSGIGDRTLEQLKDKITVGED